MKVPIRGNTVSGSQFSRMGTFGFQLAAYLQWLAAPISAREVADAYLANALFDAHADDPERRR